MIIFKAQNTNSKWIPTNTPLDQHFLTSTSSWTLNSHGFKQLQKVFEPESQKKAGNQPQLLIIDSHSSHITGDLITLCMQKNINLLTIPPHCSHLLQPLDVRVYGPLKRYHAQEVDQYTQAGITRTQRAHWVEIFIRIREKALTTYNIQARWKGAGLVAFNPRRVLNNLLLLAPTLPLTPQNIHNTTNLDLLVLQSSSLDSTKL